MKSPKSNPIPYKIEVTDYSKNIRYAGQAILHLINNFDFDILKYNTNNEKGYLIDICLNSQDNYEKLVNYFLEKDNN